MDIREELLFINEKEVLSLLTAKDAIEAAEDTFLHIGTGDITVGNMSMMFVDPDRKNNFHSMPAIIRHKKIAGVKWIDTYSAPLPGYPFSHGNLVILSDIITGSPIAIVGATNITAMAHSRRAWRSTGKISGTAGAKDAFCYRMRLPGKGRHKRIFDTSFHLSDRSGSSAGAASLWSRSEESIGTE